jgi:hypothetical protein
MGIKDWFTDEVYSRYVIFIATVVAGAVGWLIARVIERRKPSIVQVQKEVERELVNIDSKVRNKLQVVYAGHSIDKLYQAHFTIRNMGEEPIEDVEIRFQLEDYDDMKFIETVLTSPDGIQTYVVEPTSDDVGRITIVSPFLNPCKVHGDYLGVTLYAPKPLCIQCVTGRGFGWSAKYFDRNEYIELLSEVLGRVSMSLGSPIFDMAGFLARLSRRG